MSYSDSETALAACVLRATTKKRKKVDFFWGKKCIRVTWLEDFDLEMTWLLYCAGAATEVPTAWQLSVSSFSSFAHSVCWFSSSPNSYVRVRVVICLSLRFLSHESTTTHLPLLDNWPHYNLYTVYMQYIILKIIMVQFQFFLGEISKYLSQTSFSHKSGKFS